MGLMFSCCKNKRKNRAAKKTVKPQTVTNEEVAQKTSLALYKGSYGVSLVHGIGAPGIRSMVQTVFNFTCHETFGMERSILLTAFEVNTVRAMYFVSRLSVGPPRPILLDRKLEEAKLAKTRLGDSLEKSPISELNELMCKRGKTVKYELVLISGPVHNSVFTIRIKIDELIVFGSGSSKKIAKKKAATAFLQEMCMRNGSTTDINMPIVDDSDYYAKKISDIKCTKNPVGSLQELCMARHWALPLYECRNEVNNPGFTVACRVQEYSATGRGRTKKLAKQDSALAMYSRFKDSV